jgi:hypothetical protein
MGRPGQFALRGRPSRHGKTIHTGADFQFLNFGLITLGLGLNALFSKGTGDNRTWLAYGLAFVFAGSTVISLLLWLEYHKIRSYEAGIRKPLNQMAPSSFWLLFFGGITLGALASAAFLYVAVK